MTPPIDIMEVAARLSYDAEQNMHCARMMNNGHDTAFAESIARAWVNIRRHDLGAVIAVAALMSDGTVEDNKGQIYSQTIDPAKTVKISASGVVAWLTRDGKITPSPFS